MQLLPVLGGCGLISLGNKRQLAHHAIQYSRCCGLISLGNKRQQDASGNMRIDLLWIDQFRE